VTTMRPAFRHAFVSAFLCLVTFNAQAWAKSSVTSIENHAKALFEEGKYAEAFSLYQKGAQMGSPSSETALGFMYATGKGTEKNPVLALEWTNKAAEQNDLEAQNILGYMYLNGLGTAQDYARALIWYGKAAQKGSAIAENHLGLMYCSGQGTAQDGLQAVA